MRRNVVRIAGAVALAWCGIAGCQKGDTEPASPSAGPSKPSGTKTTKGTPDPAAARRRELLYKLNSPKVERRIEGARELAAGAKIGLPAPRLLCGMLAKEEEDEARKAELKALGKVQPNLRDPVATLLTDEDMDKQRKAAVALGKLGKDGRPAVAVLAAHVRKLVAVRPEEETFAEKQIPGLVDADLAALVAVGPAEAETRETVLLVVRQVSGYDYYVRSLRRAGVKHLGALAAAQPHVRREAVTTLIPILSEPYTARMRVAGWFDLRADAALALVRCGADAKPAVTELKRLKESDDEPTRDAATQALKAIEGR